MTKQVLFIQGAGQGAHEEDKELADELQELLGPEYEVRCPEMPDEKNAPYEQWKRAIEQELAKMKGPVILIGHSVGGSVLIKCMSEVKTDDRIVGLALLATPFWGGDGWLYEGYEKLELAKGFAAKLPKSARLFLYQSTDDEIVPFAHLALYAQVLPGATVRELSKGGHQLNGVLPVVAKDIRTIAHEARNQRGS